MNPRPCSGCGLMRCQGECYFEEPPPEDETCPCGLPLDDGECAVCDAAIIALRKGELGLTETVGDPMKRRAA